MDFFQGSLLPNFIPFCLDNQNTDEHQFQTNTASVNLAEPSQSSIPVPVLRATPNPVSSPPPFPPIRAVHSQAPQMAADSPFSSGSNVDVRAYADEVVQRMEVSQELIDTNLINPTEERPLTAQGQNTPNASHVSEFVRTRTPTPPEQSGAEEVSLSLLESTLSVAPQTQSGFPELQLAQIQTHETPAVSFLHLPFMSLLHFPQEPDSLKPQGTTVTPTTLWKLLVGPKSLSFTLPSLLARSQRRKGVKTQGWKHMIQDHQGRPNSSINFKRKFCDICQGEVELS